MVSLQVRTERDIGFAEMLLRKQNIKENEPRYHAHTGNRHLDTYLDGPESASLAKWLATEFTFEAAQKLGTMPRKQDR